MKKDEIFAPLTTEFYDKVKGVQPFNIYPRPTLVRDSFLLLNGEWSFSVTDGNIPEVFEEKIIVPYPPESMLSGIGRQIEEGRCAVYQRKFDIPTGFLKERFILHFGAVDTLCTVYFNGEKVGEHEGGYLPFSFDLTDTVREKDNLITVVSTCDFTRVYPYGKKKKDRGGMWYTPASGIWKSVWAESVPESYIKSIKITTDTETATVEIVGAVDGASVVIPESGEGFPVVDGKAIISPCEKRLWSPESPYLYDIVITSGEDVVKSYFALREIGIEVFNEVPRLTLNKKPYLFNGLLDQGYFPEGILTPASVEVFEKDITVAKEMGFNVLRKHIKIEPDIFYHLCDKLGMIVFQDMVNNSSYSFLLDTVLPTVGLKRIPDKFRHRSKKTREIFISHMKETMEHLYSFPSILYYTVFNEGWGQFCADEVYAIAKKTDPTRIIDATSGWFVRRDSDVDSRHVYFKPVKVKKGSKRPVVISEFGGYSLRIDGHLFGSRNYGYRIFKTKEELTDAFEKLYLNEILPGIKNGISGLVYTQVSDVEDETNGIMTYDRRVIKPDAERVRRINEILREEMDKNI